MQNEKPVILVLDDSYSITSLLQLMLKEEDYHVIVANKWQEAFARMEEILPDILLLDVMLEGIDGLTFCKKLKTQKKLSDIPVIIISSRNKTPEIKAAFESGCDDYLIKPINRFMLNARIKSYLEIQRLKNENCKLRAKLGE